MIRLVKRIGKRVLRPVTKVWVTRQRLAEDLRRLGIHHGGIVLVHSSLSSLGYVRGGAKAVIWALLDVLGPEGTLVLPTHSFRQMNAGCRTFDARQTGSCVGALTETFRKMPGVHRSLHPTHSVAAFGPHAVALTEGHERSSTPCGDGTPYARLLERDGQILLLGVGLRNLTVFHTVEALADVPYLLKREPETFALVDASGHRESVSFWRHEPGVSRRFPDTEDFLAAEGVLKHGRVGSAPSMLVSGRRFCDSMMTKLQQDPTFLLRRPVPSQVWCGAATNHD
jgi:aminoglycoside 3-N-acetyltransferase